MFFERPASIEPRCKRVRAYGKDGEVIDLAWPSAFTPLWSREALVERFASLPEAALAELGLSDAQSVVGAVHEIGIDRSGQLHEKYFRARANRTAHARWFRHLDGPRPCAVLLHGYMGGDYLLEERLWPVQKLWRSGMDVVFPVLPFHGPRRSEARRLLPPAFPSNDPRFTIEAFRQLVQDGQALFDYLLAGRVSDLGIMGQSFGGYSSALLATLENRLKFAVFFIPLAAIDEFAHTHGRLIGAGSEQLAQREALRMAHWPVSPLARPSQLSGDNVIVVAGESDAVTGMKHAEQLAKHFGARLTTFTGGHLVHIGRAQAFMPVWEMLVRRGLMDHRSKA
jgi:pimeloyl-ACP methyl ester carboxylesterase